MFIYRQCVFEAMQELSCVPVMLTTTTHDANVDFKALLCIVMCSSSSVAFSENLFQPYSVHRRNESMDGNNLFYDNGRSARVKVQGHFTSLQYRVCDIAGSRMHSTTLQ